MVALPLIAVLLVFALLSSIDSSRPAAPGEDARGPWIQSVALVGGGLALLTEALSLAHALTPAGVGLAWACVDVLLLVWVRPRVRGFLRQARGWSRWREGWGRGDRLVLLGIVCLALVLLGIALLSQPNTVDSLLYHMPRVAHWTQDRSLAPYPSQYGNQIWYPPFAEEVILHLRLLAGGDGPASLPQWFSYASLVIIVGALTRALGGGPKAELVGMAFFASMPMALLQATSTQNDLVSAHWLLVLAYFVVLAAQRPLTRRETVALGAAAGLGLLTKATLYVIEVPLLAWYAGALLARKETRAQSLARLSGSAAVAASVNIGYWWRNLATSGGPLGPAEHVRATTNAYSILDALWNAPSAVLRAIVVHAATPFQAVNDRLIEIVASLTGRPGMTGLEFNLMWLWNHEDFATAPLHVALALLAGAWALIRWRGERKVTLYVGAAGAAAFLFAVLLPYSGHPNGLRYHLPLLALAAPVVGLAAERILPRSGGRALSFGLLLLAIPYAAFNSARPLIGMTADPEGLEIPCVLGCTAVGSVLDAPPMDLLFANRRELQGPYTQVAEATTALGCRAVGLRLDSHDPEYPFWRLLRPGEGWRIESVYPLEELRPLVDPAFRPCAVICTICGGRERLHGLPRVLQVDGVSLFAGDGFLPDPDAGIPAGG